MQLINTRLRNMTRYSGGGEKERIDQEIKSTWDYFNFQHQFKIAVVTQI